MPKIDGMAAKQKKLRKPGPGDDGLVALGALAAEAKGAADRAGAAIDEALASVDASNKRIDVLEAQAKKKPR
ncbi:hypothetical protein [Rhodoferax ferrireducens]|uniref:hypothetical protein n=1 Tax=Rhodoferax ferrireducens TaxID=192843 RepID=UPI0005A2F2D3|nr:hypothetical protein [Rhodoferax ferrireducens]